MKNPVILIPIVLIFFIVSISISIFFFVGQTSTKIERVNEAKATSALMLVRKHLPIPESEYVTRLIASGKYQKFEKLSYIYEGDFENDPLYESPLVKLYDAFDGKSSGMEKHLKKWVETSPSYMSYTAIGAFYTHRGYYLRGDDFISKTPDKSIRDMQEMHTLAKFYLRKAIKENDLFSPPYTLLMYAEKSSGNHREIEKIHNKAVKLIPETYYIRYNYIGTLLPRWGGSYSAMSAYLDSINYDQISNPRVWALQGSVEGEKAYTASLREDYTATIKHYTEALKYGENAFFLRKRGEAYWHIDDLEEALEDLGRALEYMEDNRKLQKWVRYLKHEVEN